MKRVIIVCGAGIVSGKEIMALELGQGLRDHGMSVEYVSAFWGTRTFRERLHELGFNNHVLRLGFVSATLTLSAVRMTLHQLVHLPSLLLSYAQLLRSFRPEKVVHTNWHHALVLLPLLSRKRDVYWSHEIVPENPKLRRVFAAINRRVGCFVAVSRATAVALERVGVPSDRIHVIYNGIDAPGIGRTRREQSEATVVGIVGQIGPWKGHEDLIAAFASAASHFPQAKLSIFGKGSDDYERHLRRQIEELGLTSRVTWHGFVADRGQIYRRLDVCVVPSRFDDPLPTSAIEASLRGVPVIASRRGGLPEIVEDGVTGFLFDAGDAEQLAARLKTLISNPALASAMGQRGSVRAGEKFDRQSFIRDFSKVLSEPPSCSQ